MLQRVRQRMALHHQPQRGSTASRGSAAGHLLGARLHAHHFRQLRRRRRPTCPSCASSRPAPTRRTARSSAGPRRARWPTPAGKGGVMAWSPDYGDYWAMITPRYAVQDFAFESSTILYTVISTGGLVQRLPYTGTAWSTNLPTYDTTLLGGHTIVAVPDGKVLVGAERCRSLTRQPTPPTRASPSALSPTPSTATATNTSSSTWTSRTTTSSTWATITPPAPPTRAPSTATRYRPSPGGPTTT